MVWQGRSEIFVQKYCCGRGEDLLLCLQLIANPTDSVNNIIGESSKSTIFKICFDLVEVPDLRS